MLEIAPLEQRGEEPLRQIARIVGVRAAPTDVGVERIPVGLAQRRQRGARRGRVVAAGGHDQAPPSRLERHGAFYTSVTFAWKASETDMSDSQTNVPARARTIATVLVLIAVLGGIAGIISNAAACPPR